MTYFPRVSTFNLSAILLHNHLFTCMYKELKIQCGLPYLQFFVFSHVLSSLTHLLILYTAILHVEFERRKSDKCQATPVLISSPRAQFQGNTYGDIWSKPIGNPQINVQSAQSDRVIGNTRRTAGKARSAIIKGTGATDKQILIILLADGYSFFQIRFYKYIQSNVCGEGSMINKLSAYDPGE